MQTILDTATEERDQWRARILRALAELRGDELVVSAERREEPRPGRSTSSAE